MSAHPVVDSAMRERLLTEARATAKKAFCPYSHFHVGAAVLAGGRIYFGCNIENASYGLTICAERVAIFTAIAAGEKRIDALALTCPDAGASDPIDYRMPCGACRQVLAEFAESEAPVFVDGAGDWQLADLLPHRFLLRQPGT
jgi:cytidine deaminase